MHVVKYKNYGCTFSGDDEADEFQNKFYWSFFELNNGVVYVLHFIELLKEKKRIDYDIEISYADSELKCGRVIKYNFNQDFFDWFNARPPVKDSAPLVSLDEKEIKCVKNFFYEKILDSVAKETDVISVS